MVTIFEVNETNKMIEQERLDVRTITLGISLLDCCDADLDALNRNIYDSIPGWRTSPRPGGDRTRLDRS